MSSIVVFDRVFARDTGGPRGTARGALHGLSLELPPGLFVFLGAPEDGTLALFEVLSGAHAPRHGRITVQGHDPRRSPWVRAQMGLLAPTPRLPSAMTVRDAVLLAMQARGDVQPHCETVLGPLGLSALQGRTLRSLGFAEARSVELALALSTLDPHVILVHEPLSDVVPAASPQVAAQLRERAFAGACVVVTTSSPADARRLGERVFMLDRGRLTRESIGGEGLTLEPHTELVVWVHQGARELAAWLSRREDLQGVSWETPRDDRGWPGGAAVRVRGTTEACALAVADAAAHTAVEILRIEEASPRLGDVRATTEALWKRVLSTATPQPVPRPPPLPPRPPSPEPPTQPVTSPPADESPPHNTPDTTTDGAG